MADGRTVKVVVDVVATSAAKASDTVKNETKKLADEVKRINQQTAEDAKRNQKVIEDATKARLHEELQAEKRLERDRKKIAADFIQSVKQTTDEASAYSKQGASAMNGFLGAFAGGFTGAAVFDVIKNGLSSIMNLATGAARSLWDLLKSASDFGSQIKDFQDKTGLAAQTISTLKFQAAQSGIAFDALATPVRKITGLLYSAQQGSEKASDALAKFGISKFDTVDEALTKSIKKIYEGKDATEQLGIATELYGAKNAQVMVAVAKNTEGNLGGAIQKAKELGIVLSQEDVDAADKFGDTMGLLGLQAQSLGARFALQLAPSITSAMEKISDVLAKNQVQFAFWGEVARGAFIGLQIVAGQVVTVISAVFNRINDDITLMTGGLVNLSRIAGGIYGRFEKDYLNNGTGSVTAGATIGGVNIMSKMPTGAIDDLTGGGGGGGGKTPRVKKPSGGVSDELKNALSKVPDSLKNQIIAAAAAYGIPESLALAQIFAESSFKTGVVSSQGAVGLTQGVPGTTGQSRFGGFSPSQMKDPKNALTFWGKYMTYLYDRYKDWDLAILAYHQGETTVDAYVAAIKAGKTGGGIIGPKGKAYLAQIRKNTSGIQGLGITDDELGIKSIETIKDKFLGFENILEQVGATVKDTPLQSLAKLLDMDSESAKRLAVAVGTTVEKLKEMTFSAAALERLKSIVIPERETAGRGAADENNPFEGLNPPSVTVEGNFEEIPVVKSWNNFFDVVNFKLKELKDSMPSFKVAIADSIVGGIETMADAFGRAVVSGKDFFKNIADGFKSLISNIISDLTRLLAQKFLTGLVEKLLGGAQSGGGGGGIFSSIINAIKGIFGGGGSGGGGIFSGASGGGIFHALGSASGLAAGLLPAIGTHAATAAGPALGGLLSGGMGLGGGLLGGLFGGAGAAGAAGGAAGGGLGAGMAALFTNPITAIIGAAIGGFFLIRHFMKESMETKLQKAVRAAYGINITDKNVLKQLKLVAKGMPGAKPEDVVQSEMAKDIIEEYATQTGQDTKKLGRNDYGNENWKGNQFGMRFNGFDSAANAAAASTGSGAGAGSFLMATLIETVQNLNEKISAMSPTDVVVLGASGASEAIADGYERALSKNGQRTENADRLSGRFI